MPITEGEWGSIASMIERMTGRGMKRDFFTAKVIKNDAGNGLIWVKELGDQPIPVVGHTYTAKYYDTDSTGVINVKTAKITPTVPSVGETVFIVLEMGSHSLPRCIGVLHGRQWIIGEDESGFGGDV